MSTGELALHGTVWLALTAWAAAEVCRSSRREEALSSLEAGQQASEPAGQKKSHIPAGSGSPAHSPTGFLKQDQSLLTSAPTSASGWRLLWSLGALALAAHLVLAMQLHHGWSHAAAVADTARQTEAKFGVNWGGGVWFNYAMVVLWLVDAAWAWLSPIGRDAARGWCRSVRGYFLFMWFNGAVVFPTGPVRWFGLMACLAVVWSWWRGRRALT